MFFGFYRKATWIEQALNPDSKLIKNRGPKIPLSIRAPHCVVTPLCQICFNIYTNVSRLPYALQNHFFSRLPYAMVKSLGRGNVKKFILKWSARRLE